MLQRTLPAGFIAPCLPTKTDKLPSGSQWLHEIKHDGFRIIARKKGAQVRLYSRPGNDLTYRFPLIVETLARLRSRSCIIDGEAVACDDNGVASFDLFRHHRANDKIFLYAFDLIELNGDDLRRDPLEVRKATLASIVATASPGIRFNEHIEGDGPTVFAHACKMGLEGIVSKRKDSAYRSGRSPDWLRKCPGREARGGGGLGEMTRHIRRKSEFVRLTNERGFPHLVELALPPEGFRDVLLQIGAFHRERRIPVRRGRSRYGAKPFYIRFCFPDPATADAFRDRFGGERLTHAAANPKPRTPATSSEESGRPKRRVRAMQYGRR